jgi:hypothetical protein
MGAYQSCAKSQTDVGSWQRLRSWSYSVHRFQQAKAGLTKHTCGTGRTKGCPGLPWPPPSPVVCVCVVCVCVMCKDGS